MVQASLTESSSELECYRAEQFTRLQIKLSFKIIQKSCIKYVFKTMGNEEFNILGQGRCKTSSVVSHTKNEHQLIKKPPSQVHYNSRNIIISCTSGLNKLVENFFTW
jgi:hypothetical protein